MMNSSDEIHKLLSAEHVRRWIRSVANKRSQWHINSILPSLTIQPHRDASRNRPACNPNTVNHNSCDTFPSIFIYLAVSEHLRAAIPSILPGRQMSINPQFEGHDQYDVMLGSVTSHFAQIDNVLLKNECIDGQYQLITAASYAANTPVDAPGFTTVNISTTGALVADLENSSITAEIQYTLRLPGYDPTDAIEKPGSDQDYEEW